VALSFLPNSWEATVEEISGVVQAKVFVAIYWLLALPLSPVPADANGAFSFTMTTGNISNSAAEVTQTEGGKGSAHMRILAS
jgi:hypothetical protein